MSGAELPRLVIDTNVALDLLVFADPTAAPILAAVEAGRARWLTADTCRRELQRVLGYPELKLPGARREQVLARYGALTAEPPAAALCPLPVGLPRCRDPDDQPFLELAVAAGADLLISRDRELLRLRRRTREQVPALDIVLPGEAARYLARA